MTIAQLCQDLQEKEALLLHARFEVGQLTAQIWDSLPGKADDFVRTGLLQSLATADDALRRALL